MSKVMSYTYPEMTFHKYPDHNITVILELFHMLARLLFQNTSVAICSCRMIQFIYFLGGQILILADSTNVVLSP